MGRAHHLLGVDEKVIQNFFMKPDVVMKRHILKKKVCRYGLDLPCSGWIPVIGFGQHSNGTLYSVTCGKFC
jgi:hypothetical protein